MSRARARRTSRRRTANEWMPTLAEGDDARLLYFLHLTHGTGRAYNVVTITAVRDGAAWERLASRLHDGDLQPWARRRRQAAPRA